MLSPAIYSNRGRYGSPLSLPGMALLALLVSAPLEAAAPATPAETAESELTPIAPAPAEPAETLRNRRVAALLAETDTKTESHWLGSGQQPFLGLYQADHSGSTFANALILHDNLQNPDWPGVVRTLRHELAAHGWNTLSMAVPDYRPATTVPPLTQNSDATQTEPELDTEATEPPELQAPMTQDAAPEVASKDIPKQLDSRVRAATAFLADKSPQPLVIIAVGSSATLVAKQAQALFLQDINGLIMIDPVALPRLEGFNEGLDMTELRIPVLDIAPEFNPRSNPELRKQNARRLQHQGYQQRIMRGSDQSFEGAEWQVVKVVRGWGEGLFKRR